MREQIEANFFGPVNCIKAVIPSMRSQGSGHIIVLTGISTCGNDKAGMESPLTK